MDERAKLKVLSVFLFCSVVMVGQTTRLSLSKPTTGQSGWGALYNANFDSLDKLSPLILTEASDYTLLSTDTGKVVVFNCSISCTATITDSLASTWYAVITSIGAGQVTIARQTAGTIDGLTSLPPLTKWQGAKIYSAGSNAYYSERGGGRVFPSEPKVYPAANCVNSVAGSAWDTNTTFTPACRAGTNNVTGVLQAIPSTGATAYFKYELPGDWTSTVQPFIQIYYASGANTSGTVIWTVSSACTKQDGSVTDDPAFVAEAAFATQTMATANRMWAQSGQFTNLTSGNNCLAGSSVIVKVVLSGTAAAAINVDKAVISSAGRLLTSQAN